MTKMIKRICEQFSYLKCSLEKCESEENLYNKAIYGMDFPCIHTVLHNFIEGEFFQRFISDFQIDLSDFFMSCTKHCPFSCYMQNKFESEIYDIVSKIVSYFIERHNFIEDESILCELAKQFLYCFTYTLPEFIDIDLHQSSENHFLKDQENTIFEFPRQHSKRESFNIDPDEIDNWLSENDTE